MRRHVIFHGKCLVVFGIIIFFMCLFGVKEYFDAKRVHTELHLKVSELERLCK